MAFILENLYAKHKVLTKLNVCTFYVWASCVMCVGCGYWVSITFHWCAMLVWYSFPYHLLMWTNNLYIHARILPIQCNVNVNFGWNSCSRHTYSIPWWPQQPTANANTHTIQNTYHRLEECLCLPISARFVQLYFLLFTIYLFRNNLAVHCAVYSNHLLNNKRNKSICTRRVNTIQLNNARRFDGVALPYHRYTYSCM